MELPIDRLEQFKVEKEETPEQVAAKKAEEEAAAKKKEEEEEAARVAAEASEEGDEEEEDPNPEEGKQPKEGVETVIGYLATQEGYVEDLDGLEDNEEGLLAYISKRDSIRDQKIISSFLESNPVLAKLHDHVSKGYPIDTFIKQEQPDQYITADVTDVETAKQVIYADLKQQGVSPERINRLISSLGSDEEVVNEAKFSQESLKKRKEESLREDNERSIREREVQLKQMQEDVLRIKTAIKKNDFNGIAIPSAKLMDFEKAMFTPTSTGKTKLEEKWERLTPEQQVILDYIVYSDFNTSSFATKKPISSLKSRFELNKSRKKVDTGGGDGGSSGGKGAGSVVELKKLLNIK
jgi:hypothetical protein